MLQLHLSEKFTQSCTLSKSRYQGADSIQRFHLTSIGNPIVAIRRSYDRLISTMGFPILVRWHLYIESGPSWISMTEGARKQPKQTRRPCNQYLYRLLHCIRDCIRKQERCNLSYLSETNIDEQKFQVNSHDVYMRVTSSDLGGISKTLMSS